MSMIRKIELDVLKPHLPGILEFARAVAALSPDYRVEVGVVEVDDKTQTLTLTVDGKALDYSRIQEVIESLGGSVHSIDRCLVVGEQDREA